MPIDPKWLKAILVTIFIVLGGIVGYQLVNQADSDEAEETFEEIRALDTAESETYSEEDINAFEASLAETESADTIEWFNYFEHTAPGEYSEIFVEITGLTPNVQKIVYVRDADTGEYISAGGQDMVTTELGHISTRFRITAYGNYEVVTYDKNGAEVVSPILVVN